ncbi:RNA-binding domain-containing protein [Aliicoccus persicus]|uniref:ATP-dependent DNA helicase RecG n=1 Tax=Aliicoccus persicus TaxID=930138 RepID=A0A662Z2R0_9STAP|nr:RNA-binding domain-containing protein [Aliicoccus persicus]SEV96892.1 ATP-dependent DNA helicase RecG [Aliicoccus persicus]
MLEKKFEDILYNSSENETVEFKAAQRNFNIHLLGKYFSALSNEASLSGKEVAWLVFGVNDPKKYRGTDKFIVGTHYKKEKGDMNKTKQQLKELVNNNLSFTEIAEKFIEGKRVIFFGIPASLRGIPTTYQDKAYGRTGESIDILSAYEMKKIYNQTSEDWSKMIVEDASIEDLNNEAIKVARDRFKVKNSNLVDEVDTWDDETFLNKAKITRKSKITNTAIILLGNPESTELLNNAQINVSWILKDQDNIEIDYEHFSAPMLINIDNIYNKIRNLNYRYIADDSLFPTETKKYDSYVLREALNNAIAHQDYGLNGKINLVEYPNKVVISNVGEFLPESIEYVINSGTPSEIYRNQFLADAMVSLNMIDTIGSGIKKMMNIQMKRTFPLPSYDITDKGALNPKVKVTIFGEIIDENYTKLLVQNSELSLKDVMLLDKVQKNVRIKKSDADCLRRQKLIEGRYPNIIIASHVADITGKKNEYLKDAGLNNDYYKAMIMTMLEKYPKSTKQEILSLLEDKLPNILDNQQKMKKVDNLLQSLSRSGKIKSTGRGLGAGWIKQ